MARGGADSAAEAGRADARSGAKAGRLFRHPETRRLRWRRCEPALGRGQGLALLKRLDAAAAAIRADELAQAEIVLGDFAVFLDLIEQGGDAAALARFFSDRTEPGRATDYV
jgi:hypothetical protein